MAQVKYSEDGLELIGFNDWGNFIIPDGVIRIGDRAFSYCTGLTRIQIPNSVTKIGGWAFSGCTGLTSIEIPNSAKDIGVRVSNVSNDSR